MFKTQYLSEIELEKKNQTKTICRWYG